MLSIILEAVHVFPYVVFCALYYMSIFVPIHFIGCYIILYLLYAVHSNILHALYAKKTKIKSWLL